jgi:hypothetical protein
VCWRALIATTSSGEEQEQEQEQACQDQNDGFAERE